MGKIEKEIHLFDEKVKEIVTDFKNRLEIKRKQIKKTEEAFTKSSITKATVRCKICETEVAKVSTLKYISDEKHHAKCSFGYLSRLEIQEACQNPKYQNEDDKSFVDLYLGLWNIKSDQI